MRNRTYSALLLILLLAASGPHAGTVYTWTDADGRTHFSDAPPPAGVESERLQISGRASRAGDAPSERVRAIRCRDFQGALVQLREVPDVAPDDPQWLAAQELAREKIDQWCE